MLLQPSDRSSQEEVGFEAQVRDKIISQVEEKKKNIVQSNSVVKVSELQFPEVKPYNKVTTQSCEGS